MIQILSIPTEDTMEFFLMEIDEKDEKRVLSKFSGLTVINTGKSEDSRVSQNGKKPLDMGYVMTYITGIGEVYSEWRKYIERRRVNINGYKGPVLISRADENDITEEEYIKIIKKARDIL